MAEELTRGVKTLLGNPKKAVLKLSGPMVIGMLVQSLYNIVDGIWVAGLGADALAAIGLFFPLFAGLGNNRSVTLPIFYKEVLKTSSTGGTLHAIGRLRERRNKLRCHWQN